MGLTIEDGKGKGYTAEVDSENNIRTKSIISKTEQHVNDIHGQSFTAMFSVTPTGAGDCFGYIKNNSDSDMMISTLMLRCASDEIIQLKIGDSGTPVGGSDITLVNRNAGSGNVADVTSQQGVDITGLSGGSVVAGAFVKGGENSLQIEIASTIIVPKNKVATFYTVTGTAAVMVGVSLYFHE